LNFSRSSALSIASREAPIISTPYFSSTPVRVHEHDAIAFRLERLARLHAGVIELARLADDDRTGADDEDALDVGAPGHGFRPSRASSPSKP
jgi:hypothetical protein